MNAHFSTAQKKCSLFFKIPCCLVILFLNFSLNAVSSWVSPPSEVFSNITVPEYVQLAVSEDGTIAFAIAQVDTGGLTRTVQVAKFENGTWHTPELIYSDTMSATSLMPQIAVSSDGQVAFAAWKKSPAASAFFTSVYSAGMWSTAAPLQATDASNITIAPNSNGSIAFMTWNVGVALYTSKYTTMDGWGTPELLDATNAFSPKLAVSSDGLTAFCTWVHFSGSTYDITVRQYSGISWGIPSILQALAGTASVQISINNDATQGVILWTRNTSGVYASHFSSGMGWGTVKSITTEALAKIRQQDEFFRNRKKI